MNKILVAGVGNLFLGDDAFGVAVAQRLSKMALPEGVRVTDFGIRSYDLAYALMDAWDFVILVDALPRGGAPGTLYTIDPDLPEPASHSIVLDAHSMNPASVLQFVTALGGRPPRMLIVGCEPGRLDPDQEGSMSLSPEVERAVDEAIRMVEELIKRAQPRYGCLAQEGERECQPEES